jgi:hypothetical protein
LLCGSLYSQVFPAPTDLLGSTKTYFQHFQMQSGDFSSSWAVMFLFTETRSERAIAQVSICFSISLLVIWSWPFSVLVILNVWVLCCCICCFSNFCTSFCFPECVLEKEDLCYGHERVTRVELCSPKFRYWRSNPKDFRMSVYIVTESWQR